MSIDPKTHTIFEDRLVPGKCVNSSGVSERDPATGRMVRNKEKACPATQVRRIVSQKKGTQKIRGKDTGRPFLKVVDMECPLCKAEWFYL